VDLAYFHPSEGPVDRSTIILSGKMSYHANVTAALYFVREVFPRVRARHPEARLRIVGSAPPTELLNLARDPAIEVTGYLADIRPSIASGAVAVCPVAVKVGIQNKILEAMALGVPVVSTAAGAVGLGARSGIDMLIGRDSDELAQHISAVLDDESLRRRLALAGRQYVETHHRWSTVADTFEALYKIVRPHHGSFPASNLG
jgi:glycosyltransferase involved in cell wall biosynthesis